MFQWLHKHTISDCSEHTFGPETLLKSHLQCNDSTKPKIYLLTEMNKDLRLIVKYVFIFKYVFLSFKQDSHGHGKPENIREC